MSVEKPVLTVRRDNIQHSAMLIKLSALQRPLLTQTAMGGKMMAIKPRKTSEPHIVSMSIKTFGVVGVEGRMCRIS